MALLKSKGTYSEDDENALDAGVLWQNSSPRGIAFVLSSLEREPGCSVDGPVKPVSVFGCAETCGARK